MSMTSLQMHDITADWGGDGGHAPDCIISVTTLERLKQLWGVAQQLWGVAHGIMWQP